MKTNVTRDELDAYWIQQLRKAVVGGECKTACWIADVRLQSEEGALLPAILVHVEHAGALSEDILYPYQNGGGSRVVFGDPTIETTDHQIFVTS